MQSIQLKRQVAIKAIITEKFKVEADKEIEGALQEVEAYLEQIKFQKKSALKQSEEKPSIKLRMKKQLEQLEADEKNRRDMKEELTQRRSIIKGLELNTEFVQGLVDNFVEIKVGDNLYEKLSNTEVLIKDGVVVEIRGRG